MARPKVKPTEKLSQVILFRVTDDEKHRLSELSEACGEPIGHLVRAKVFKGKFPELKAAKMDADSYVELKKIGVNLNQLTRKVNAGLLEAALLPLLEKLEQHEAELTRRLLYDRGAEDW